MKLWKIKEYWNKIKSPIGWRQDIEGWDGDGHSPGNMPLYGEKRWDSSTPLGNFVGGLIAFSLFWGGCGYIFHSCVTYDKKPCVSRELIKKEKINNLENHLKLNKEFMNVKE